jgi:hypothetical protein
MQLDLPRSDFGSLSVPDSVEDVHGNIGSVSGQRRALEFGRESSLISLNLKNFQLAFNDCAGNKVFARF